MTRFIVPLVFVLLAPIVSLACGAGHCTSYKLQGTVSVETPTLAVRHDDISGTVVPWESTVPKRIIDAPITTFSVGGNQYWMNSNYLSTTKYQGSIDHPFQTQISQKPTEEMFLGSQAPLLNPDGSRPGYWIVNTYTESDGILTIVHKEYPRVSNGEYKTGSTRIGLAWSKDSGNHFKYIGDILKPNTDPDNWNIEGAPFLIKEGYMYIYYKDLCVNGNIAVARAPLIEILTAAKRGNVTSWKKYYNGSWSSDGLGGLCSKVNIEDGITHTDAAYSTYNGKYYALLSTMNWNGIDTWIKLYESSDLLNWRFVKTVVRESANAVLEGYQYVSIVDASGSDNGIVGQRFYVYSVKNPTKNALVYRWLIDLGGSGDAPSTVPLPTSFSFITGYSSTQGSHQWSYVYRKGVTESLMTWGSTPWNALTKLWRGDETYALIGTGWMHPGAAVDTVLKWTAPQDGSVRITGTASGDKEFCGNGVIVSISRNENQLWKQIIGNSRSVGKSHDLHVVVSADDNINFIVNSRDGNNACDIVIWNPTVEY